MPGELELGLKVTTVSEVLDRLNQLDIKLCDSQLEPAREFNRAYIVVTRNVLTHINKDYFKQPEKVESFDVEFAGYYFLAVNEYLETHQTSGAWRCMFETASKRRLSSFRYLIKGANVHVNHDLPQALGDSPVLADDYDRVNEIIDGSVAEILRGMTVRKPLDQTIKIGAPLCSILTRHVMRYWRRRSWRKYLELA